MLATRMIRGHQSAPYSFAHDLIRQLQCCIFVDFPAAITPAPKLSTLYVARHATLIFKLNSQSKDLDVLQLQSSGPAAKPALKPCWKLPALSILCWSKIPPQLLVKVEWKPGEAPCKALAHQVTAWCFRKVSTHLQGCSWDHRAGAL